MILVDVFVPALDKSYDFLLDESATVAGITEEIIEMISRSERFGQSLRLPELMLADTASCEIMAPERTVVSYGIVTGTKLLLV